MGIFTSNTMASKLIRLGSVESVSRTSIDWQGEEGTKVFLPEWRLKVLKGIY
jgi:hypothetical protein